MPILRLILASSLAVSGGAAEEPLPVILFAGQSNMVGKRCVVADLPEDLRGPLAPVLFFDAAAGWIPLEAGKTEAQGFGPEIAFAKDFAARWPGSFGIVKHAIGGTNLHTDWSPQAPGPRYRTLHDLVTAAGKARPIRVIGMVWSQGGADAKEAIHAEAYAANLLALIERARADFAHDLAFVCVRANPPDKPFIAQVRAAQTGCPAHRYALVDSDGFSVGPDRIHFDTPGMVASGRACAAAMATLVGR